MELLALYVIVVWVIVNGMVAKAKNCDVTRVVLASIVLSPLFPYLWLLAIPARPPKPEKKPGDGWIAKPTVEEWSGSGEADRPTRPGLVSASQVDQVGHPPHP